MPVESKSGLRTAFFDAIFGAREGYACIAISDPNAPRSRFDQKFFKWPKEGIRLERYVNDVESKYNVYFCPTLFEVPVRQKQYCLPTDVLWADLDEVSPADLQPPPQVVIRSSANRWQALWLLGVELEPLQAEQYNKRIAYATGADKSGWDLTQLLRVPLTRNRKYVPPPEIELMMLGTETKCPPLLFESMPQPPDDDPIVQDSPMPAESDLPELEQVIYKFSHKINGATFTATYTHEPAEDQDWSKLLWKLIHMCFEAGMSLEETFVVTNSSAVNKYKRDKRPISHLWRDILKAHQGYQRIVKLATAQQLRMPLLVDPDAPVLNDLFIDRYREWACEATDAVPQFHDLSAVILLSTIIGNSVRLETSYGVMVPNLWGMILGDSTLSRKTTAMRMVTDLIAQLDPELVLATDGTAEGLLTGLETRPNKTSIFYKDELSGFFESINRREYLAGMPETLTALYDVPPIYTRRLRKEVIRIENPVFIFFGGGVRDSVYEALTEQYVLSGFLPRFLIVSGDTDFDRLRNTGPPTELGIAKRSNIVSEIADLYEYYAADVTQRIAGQPISIPPRVMAHMSNDAWARYGKIETLMVRTANESNIQNLALPTFERLSRSILKLACVIAASRQTPKDETILVEEIDVVTAASYIQVWGEHSIELIMNAGKRVGERVLDRLAKAIEKDPGILRSSLMTRHHLTKREADDILGTLEDRGTVRKEKQGRGYAYWTA